MKAADAAAVEAAAAVVVAAARCIVCVLEYLGVSLSLSLSLSLSCQALLLFWQDILSLHLQNCSTPGGSILLGVLLKVSLSLWLRWPTRCRTRWLDFDDDDLGDTGWLRRCLRLLCRWLMSLLHHWLPRCRSLCQTRCTEFGCLDHSCRNWHCRNWLQRRWHLLGDWLRRSSTLPLLSQHLHFFLELLDLVSRLLLHLGELLQTVLDVLLLDRHIF